MTEAEWFACTNPKHMVEFLIDGPGTDRRLRLFGCACCRQVWDLLTEECFRAAVEVAEQFADGRASRKELAAAKKESGAALERNGLAGVAGLRDCALSTAWSCTRNPPTAAIYPLWVLTDEAQRRLEVQLLRDIFGNPFRAVSLAPSWLAWNDGTVPKLARAIYDERVFDRLPILEDAGCPDASILGHLHVPGPQVRGCWALDLLLGKS